MCWTFKYNCFSLRASSNSLPYHLKSQAKFLPSKLVSLGSTTLLQLLALPGGMHLASAHNKFPSNYTSGRKKMLWLFFSQNRFKNKGKGSEKKKKKRESRIYVGGILVRRHENYILCTLVLYNLSSNKVSGLGKLTHPFWPLVQLYQDWYKLLHDIL